MGLTSAAFASVVPWRYRERGERSLWSWQTGAFLAVVIRTGAQWQWEVSVNDTVVLASGSCSTFASGEEFCLESIGKAFPSYAGYTELTDGPAARYTFADGQRYDLGPMGGQDVVVTLDSGLRLVGVLGIRDWLLHLTSGDQMVDLHPAHVVRVDPHWGP